MKFSYDGSNRQKYTIMIFNLAKGQKYEGLKELNVVGEIADHRPTLTKQPY